jgi:hypothetical protein
MPGPVKIFADALLSRQVANRFALEEPQYDYGWLPFLIAEGLGEAAARSMNRWLKEGEYSDLSFRLKQVRERGDVIEISLGTPQGDMIFKVVVTRKR